MSTVPGTVLNIQHTFLNIVRQALLLFPFFYMNKLRFREFKQFAEGHRSWKCQNQGRNSGTYSRFNYCSISRMGYLLNEQEIGLLSIKSCCRQLNFTRQIIKHLRELNFKLLIAEEYKSKKSKVLFTQSCLILFNPMDCSPPGTSVYGILPVRILERHYQRNANQNHNEVPLHASQDGCYPKVYKQ